MSLRTPDPSYVNVIKTYAKRKPKIVLHCMYLENDQLPVVLIAQLVDPGTGL